MTTALYRRYRPETFADVIGQEHVTAPLMAAIDKDRINHAYLFSGPRGCGKTTSARILARCLNCAQGPTSTPCGVCDSCVELARGGSGSLDVIEIDAASHGGVDDARDLRERATFAPVRDRFKIFIIDEAHMVTSAGFNALLKIVEEPPEHILFIFATTEPDKVIGTIRSRTHHYPFRLVPPEPLLAYLEQLCRQENVSVAPGVLSLVIRAGGGSVRDSLSVLDQLMAGAGENGLDYELAVSLLGYTHATLLDDVVDSMAADDAGTVFNAVDRVIQTGHDPRRFVEDLLERFRDLIVINAVPEGATSILRGVPEDQLNRMRTQANQLGAGELSRAADITNTALTEMTGATSPRLHLELLCARLLLPAADASVRGTLARVDRIERRLEYAGGAPAESGPAPATTETPKVPARPRLDVPRNAEEAAARWALPKTDAPETPADKPAASTPAGGPRTDTPAADSSPDWGGSWGVSTDSAFAEPASPARPAAGAGSPAASGPAIPAAQKQPAPRDAGHPGQQTDAGAPLGGEPGRAAADPDRGPSTGSTGGQPEPWSESDSETPSPTGTPSDPGGSADVDAAWFSAGDPAEEHRQPGTGTQGARPDAERSPGPAVPSARPEEQRSSGPGGQAEPVRQPERQDGPPTPPQDVRGTAPQQQSAPSGGNIEMVRRAWPEIMDEVAKIKRATWLIVNVSAKPRSFEGNQLVLAFVNQGNAIGFQRGPHVDNLKQAIHTVLGLTCSIEAMHDAGGSGESGPKVPASSPARDSIPGPSPAVPSRQGTGTGEVGETSSMTPQGPGPQRAQQDPRSTREPADPAPQVSGPSSPSDPQHIPGRTGNGELAGGAPGNREGAPRPPAPGSSTTSQPAPPTDRAPGSPGTSAAPRSQTSTGHAPSSPPPRKPRTRDAQQPAAGREPSGTAGTGPETVSAWDPSMSDDSWALVEPPEDAFDPGPGWQASAQRTPGRSATDDAPGTRHGSTRAPSRTDPARDPDGQGAGEDGQHGRAQGAPRDPSAPDTRARPPVNAEPPAPRPSRSVIWSPDVDGGSSPPSGPRPDAASSGPRGIPHFIGSPADGASGPSTRSSTAPGPGGAPTGNPDHDASAGSPMTGRATAASDAPPQSTPPPGAPTTRPPEPASEGPGADTSGQPGPAHGARKPGSRYQQLLDEAERTRAEQAAAARGVVDFRYVEDEPSADDETLEDSGLVGRTAIERILNGRLIEERGVNGR